MPQNDEKNSEDRTICHVEKAAAIGRDSTREARFRGVIMFMPYRSCGETHSMVSRQTMVGEMNARDPRGPVVVDSPWESESGREWNHAL
jgi:hypothetical protein